MTGLRRDSKTRLGSIGLAFALVAAFVAVSGGGAQPRSARPVLLGPERLAQVAFTGGAHLYLRFGGVTSGTGTIHTGDIEVQSFQFGVGRGITTPAGGTGREASAPSVSEIVVTKLMDASSTKLLNQLLGTTPQLVTLFAVHAVTNAPTEELEYTFEQVLLSKFSESGSGGSGHESISLNFTKITMTYKLNGSAKSRVCYDLALAKKC